MNAALAVRIAATSAMSGRDITFGSSTTPTPSATYAARVSTVIRMPNWPSDWFLWLVIGGANVVGWSAIAVMGWAQWRDSRPEQFDGKVSDK